MLVEAFRMGFSVVSGVAGAFPRRVLGEAFDGLCCSWGGATKVVEDHNLYGVTLGLDGVVVMSFFGLDRALSRVVAECALGWVASLYASEGHV